MARATTRERINVGILAANQALYLVAAITVMTLSGLVGQQLAPNPALATLPIAMMMIGVVLAAVPASLWMKRVGRRAGFITGALLGGAGGGAVSVLAIGVGSFALFCAGSLLLGVYQAFANYHRFAAADAASPAFESQAISLVLAGGVVAAFLGPLNATRLAGLLGGAGPYAVIIVLALLGSVLHLGLRIPHDDEARTGAQRPLREIAANRAVPVAVLAATVGYTIMILVMTATPLAMRQSGFDLPQIATVMQLHVLGMFLPSFVTGHLIARFGLPRMLLVGATVLAVSSGTAAAGQTMPHYLFALVLLGVGWNFLFVGGSALLATAHRPGERAKVQGVNELVVFGAVAVGSLLAGTLVHTAGWTMLNLLMLPLIAATAATTVWWRYRGASRPGAPVPVAAAVAATATELMGPLTQASAGSATIRKAPESTS